MFSAIGPGGATLLVPTQSPDQLVVVRTDTMEIVETIPLTAPEADALGLELAAFVAAVRGERAAIVTGVEGRAALALALEVTAAVQRSPQPALGR
jgi:predicted dehydrogenase